MALPPTEIVHRVSISKIIEQNRSTANQFRRLNFASRLACLTKLVLDMTIVPSLTLEPIKFETNITNARSKNIGCSIRI
jgi:hypothetical protein